jgi:hypothetical protein
VGGAVWLFIVPCACPLLFRRYCACLKDVAPFGVSSPWSRPVFLFVLDLGAGWGFHVVFAVLPLSPRSLMCVGIGWGPLCARCAGG